VRDFEKPRRVSGWRIAALDHVSELAQRGLAFAPTIRFTGAPSLNRIIVRIDTT
jgi:hypothetical protein